MGDIAHQLFVIMVLIGAALGMILSIYFIAVNFGPDWPDWSS